MAYANKDRFGNDYTVVGCYDKKGKGYPVGYVELKGQLYKIEPSEAQKDKQNRKGEDLLSWVKITKVQKRSQASKSM